MKHTCRHIWLHGPSSRRERAHRRCCNKQSMWSLRLRVSIQRHSTDFGFCARHWCQLQGNIRSSCRLRCLWRLVLTWRQQSDSKMCASGIASDNHVPPNWDQRQQDSARYSNAGASRDYGYGLRCHPSPGACTASSIECATKRDCR